MVYARKKRQSNRRLLSQLDDFNKHVIIGNALCESQESITVNKGEIDREYTVGSSSSNAIY